ncbi:hypothetical protein HOA55_03135 [archaeon]|jgi:hypothetical protein|nr:hypothetical protein [archaeon]MBT3577433.1 hypothetical protein [archaeon]MBT6820324.1 hypothetical protein [archaeon]MBT6956125.1 hypothetical protein [archaeon]MBT7025138.1 hypothetical protein [archaeon]
MNELRIGVVGSEENFDEAEAQEMILEAFDKLDLQCPTKTKIIVSGLTDRGIKAIAYREATKRNWGTMGIACSRAREYDCFPVDEKIIEGNEWGDESSTFLDNIEVLIRIGGGNQSFRETAEAKARGKQVMEGDLS